MISNAYRGQVALLLQVLPHVMKEENFALKGGTAITLFVRDMPRLSVDIDLTWLPFDNRTIALEGITNALRRVKERIENNIPQSGVKLSPQSDGRETKLSVQTPATQIKVEVNTLIRGSLFTPVRMRVVEIVETEFGLSASANVISQAEMFGGKICAALDRQHPRDLFDVRLMLDNEGLANEIRMGVIAGLLSHSRPIHEMIAPNFLDQRQVFENQFEGMAFIPFTYEDFEATRKQLVQEISESLTDSDREFLLSFKRG